jgi:hypothetical protein
MTVFDLVLASLATYRLTRLFTADKITQPLREWITARSDWFGYLVTCDWCLSIWLSTIPTFLIINHGDNTITRFGLLALCASALTGLVSMIETRLDT